MQALKKRAAALALAAVLAAALCVPGAAAENSAKNFVRFKTYSGEFSDVAPGSVFYENAAALYEYGLSVGKGDGTFGLREPMTVGQIVIFAARIRSLYAAGDPEAGAAAFSAEGQAAYAPYLAYLQSEGVLSGELDGLYFLPATRAQTAHVLAGTLPESALPPVNDALVTTAYASRRYITDVTEYTPYYADILALYRAGICIGSDGSGSFQPGASITRGAAAAMLTRMVDPALRLTPNWTPETTYASAADATWGSLVTGDTTYTAAPATREELAADVAHMLARESSVLELDYGGPITARTADSTMNAALDVVKSYCEQMYNYVSCTYSTQTGRVRMTFSAVSAGGALPAYREYTLAAATAVHDRLWSEGQITASMTQTEKARVYYRWICENCVYDSGASSDSLSHIAYSLFHDGRAVCDGYAGAYNLLLKLEGIECRALSNPDHIWTVATLDGVSCHIDVTWGDVGDAPDYRYFAMTPEQSWSYHTW